MAKEISRDHNRIKVAEITRGSDLRRMSATIHQTIEDRGYREVTLDFSKCAAATEAAMLPLMPLIVHWRESKGIGFALIEPDSYELRRLFWNTNWSHFIDPGRYPESGYTGTHVPARQYHTADEMGETFESVLTLIPGELETNRATVAAVEWSLGEVMDNVISHAESPVGGFVQATAYRGSNRVEFIVADAGMGIARSMRIEDPVRALTAAITEGVTRDQSVNAGNGLFGSHRVAALSENGQFEIHSGNGVLYYDRLADEPQARFRKTPFGGTSVRCGIGLNKPDLLHKALRFKGKPETPLYDVIERRFEDQEGTLMITVKKDAARDIGSRSGGRRVRQLIENLLGEQNSIVVDFEGVGVISSSFADEVFGRLFVTLGPRAFMTRVEMRNVGPTVEGLIDRAILQRTRLGNGDD